jgi:hypothetical protein
MKNKVIFIIAFIISIINIIIPIMILESNNELQVQIETIIWLISGVVSLGLLIFLFLMWLTNKNK